MRKQLSAALFPIVLSRTKGAMLPKMLDLIIEIMISEARRQASEKAVQYRNFHVGCAVLASNGHDYRIFYGANLMPIKGGHKVCAEQTALKLAFLADYRDILLIVVAGKTQPDDDSGVVPHTLHPCADCRTIIPELYRVDPHALIYTTSLHENGPAEIYRLRDILDLHSRISA